MLHAGSSHGCLLATAASSSCWQPTSLSKLLVPASCSCQKLMLTGMGRSCMRRSSLTCYRPQAATTQLIASSTFGHMQVPLAHQCRPLTAACRWPSQSTGWMTIPSTCMCASTWWTTTPRPHAPSRCALHKCCRRSEACCPDLPPWQTCSCVGLASSWWRHTC